MARKVSTDAEINSIRLKEQASSPSTPASGYGQLYEKSDEEFYFKGDGGIERDLIPRSSTTLVVAASGSVAALRGQADYICDGVADNVQIQAAIDALSSGGRIYLTEGEFILSGGITLSGHIELCGVGYGTNLNASGLPSGTHVITVSSGTDWVYLYDSIHDIHITLPSSNPGDAIRTVSLRGSFLELRRIFVTGGSSSAWGITLDGCTNIKVDEISIYSNCNGIRFCNLANASITGGNATISNCHINLLSNNTRGFHIEGNSNGNVNFVTLLRCEAITTESSTNCDGFYIGNYTFRVTSVDCDVENLNLAYQLGNGGTCGDFTFINSWIFSCATGTVKNVPSSRYVYVIGGNDDFADIQSYVLGRMPTIHITGSRILSETEIGKVMVTDSITATGTSATLTLPAANNDFVYRYTITNVNATTLNTRIVCQCGAGDFLINTDGSTSSSLTSSGALGDSITVQNINYKYWRVEDKIGTWT